MSFDRDKRPETIRAFLDELGISGTERLRRSGADPASDSNEPEPARKEETPPMQQPARVVTGPVPHEGKRREIARHRRKRASRRRSLVLLPVLAALATWYFYGEPHDDIANLAARISGSNQPPPAAESASAAVVTTEPGPGQETVEPDVPASVDAEEDSPPPAVAEPAADVTAVAATPGVDSHGQPGIDAEIEAEIGPGIDSGIDTPGNTLIQSLVTVYERDGAARIAFRRPLGTTGTVLWWTADDSARADSDYIPLEQPVAAFVSGEEAETLHIPLVNDGLPEPKETFFVFLGQRDPATGALEPIARVRVDVNDDD